MKKMIVFALSAVMCLSMSLAAVAAPSPGNAGGSAVIDGNTVQLTIGTVEEARKNEVATPEALKNVMSSAYVDGMSVASLMEVSLPAGTAMPAGGVDITLTVAGVKAGDTVKVLHYTGTAWEVITPSAVADGKVTAHFNSLSPVAVVVKSAETDNNSNSGSGSSGGSSSSSSSSGSSSSGSSAAPASASPKTGESNVLMMAGLAAIFFVATAVTSGYQMKKNR